MKLTIVLALVFCSISLKPVPVGAVTITGIEDSSAAKIGSKPTPASDVKSCTTCHTAAVMQEYNRPALWPMVIAFMLSCVVSIFALIFQSSEKVRMRGRPQTWLDDSGPYAWSRRAMRTWRISAIMAQLGLGGAIIYFFIRFF